MDFLPMPQKIVYQDGVYIIRFYSRIVLQNTDPSVLLYAQLLRNEIQHHTGLSLEIRMGDAMQGMIVLTIDPQLPANTYRLKVEPAQVTVSAGSDEALLHGAMTLSQYVARCGCSLPAVEIEDWPDYPVRGYYLDCSRGRVPTLETLKMYVDLLCRFKLNQFQLYIEHTYLFRRLSEAWRDDTPLSAEDILELDRYCRERHIELVPSLSSFGHMYKILSTKTCARLCELEGSEKEPFRYTYAAKHHTLNVSHHCTMKFIKQLISEYRELFTSSKFNICCDETYDLGRGRSKELAAEKGVHTLYMEHVTELCRWLLDQGVTPMFWGDIIIHHPETYQQIPEGVICLNWEYSADVREEKVKALADAGATQYVCPGVATWNHWFPMAEESYHNIRRMALYGRKYGAAGLLNTDWGDYGHVCHPWLSIPGILYGAAFGWRAEDVSFDELNRAISLFAFGDHTRTFVSDFAHISGHEGFDWRHAIHWIEAETPEARAEVMETVDYARIPEINESLASAVRRLESDALHLDSRWREIMQAVTIAACGIRLINEIGVYIAVHFCGAEMECRNGDTLASDLEYWFRSYMNLWRTVSRESTVYHLRDVIIAYADMLRGR